MLAPKHALSLFTLALSTVSLLACLGGDEPAPVDPSPQAPVEPASDPPKVELKAELAPPAERPEKRLETTPVGQADIPAGLDLQGEVVGGARFTDSEGENLLVLTEVPEHGSGKDADMRGAELYGYRLVRTGGAWKQAWKIQDFVRECPNDITASHLPESVRVTDLDEDGLAETSFQYRVSCRGDVSPAGQKLMMHEGTTKYALRGQARIEAGGQAQGGEYEVDPAFEQAPRVFLAHAKRLWASYSLETF